jgi:hypothetical protein
MIGKYIKRKIRKNEGIFILPKFISYNKIVRNCEELYISVLQRKGCILASKQI